MFDTVINYLFETASFVPHGVCLLWRPDLVALHGTSDLLITIAYLTIPLLIVDFARKRPDLVDARIAMMFTAFITACAISHFASLLTIWMPYYGLQGLIKAATAAISLYTAWHLWQMRGAFLAMPSPANMAEARADLMVAQAMREKTEESNRRLEEFAYIAAHDMRAPLRAMTHVPDWLREDLKDRGMTDPEVLEHIDMIQQQAQRMDALLVDLLDYARIGDREDQIEDVHMGQLVTKVIGLLRPGPGFDIRLEGSMPVIGMYRAEVELILRNLISNALKHHDRSHGVVTVRSTGREGNLHAFEIEDDGPGIPEDMLDRIFEKFSRLKSRNNVEGTGLGLTAVRKAVQAAGGTISARNVTDGRGVIFGFTLENRSRMAA